ncbi:hypothetical protein [Deinococcus navajonensis]|uniref:Uncharacterized protein n=1 Tax=Deinococcus navajonensis TaxID=309884 RepID=A0ABV8XHD3_9DEIO
MKQRHLDVNVMMNDKRDFVPDQAQWLDQWNSFAAPLRAAAPEVHQVSGSAIQLHDQASSVNQVWKTRAAGLSGWAGQAYRTPDVAVNSGARTRPQVLPDLTAKLTGPIGLFEHPGRWERPGPAPLRAISRRVTVGRGPLGSRTVRPLDSHGKEAAQTLTGGQGRSGVMRLPLGPVLVEVKSIATGPLTPQPRQVTVPAPLALP